MENLAKYRKFFVTLLPMAVVAWNTFRPDGAAEVTPDQVDMWINALAIVLTPILVYAVPNADNRS